MRNRIILITAILLIAVTSMTLYVRYVSPTRVAVVAFPDFMVEKMERSNNNPWVKIDKLELEELDEIDGYGLVIVRAHGTTISQEQLNLLRQASEKGLKIFVADVTNPEYDLTNLSGEELDYFTDLLDNKCIQNFQSLFNYARTEIDFKRMFTKPYADAVILPDDFFFHGDDEQVFETVKDYEAYYKENGFYKEGAPKVALLSGNINIQNSNSEHTLKLIQGLEDAGLNVYPLRSFGDKKLQLLKDTDPDLVIFRPHGRLASGNSEEAINWLVENNIPVLAPLTVYDEYDNWVKDQQGMSGAMLSMSVVLPEIDGAVVPYALMAQFQGESGNLIYDAIPNRIDNFCEITANWLTLQKKKNENKKVAIYYFKGPGQNALVASNMEVIPSLFNLLRSLQNEGYNLEGLPETEEEFELLIMTKGPVLGTYALGAFDEYLKNGDPELVEKETYEEWCNEELPTDLYQQVLDKYGEPPGDYMSVEKNGQEYIAVTRLQFGNVCLLPQPLPGIGEDSQELIHGANSAPPHTYIASYLWASHSFDADAIIHFGTHGSLEFTPGKQVALSDYDWPDRLIGNTPHFYVYTISNIGEGIIAKRRTYATLLTYLTPPFMKSGLNEDLDDLSQKLDNYNILPQGPVKEQYALTIKQLAEKQNIHRAIGLDSTRNYTPTDVHQIHEYLEEIEEEKVTAGLYTMGVPYEESKLQETVSLMVLDPIAFGLAELDAFRGTISRDSHQDNLYVSENYRPKAQKIIQQVFAGGDANAILSSLITDTEREMANQWNNGDEEEVDLMSMMMGMGSGTVPDDIQNQANDEELIELIIKLCSNEDNAEYIESLKSQTIFEKSSQMLDVSYRAKAVELAEEMKGMAPEMYESVNIARQEDMLRLLEIMQDSISRERVFELVEDEELEGRLITSREQELIEKADLASSPDYLAVIDLVFSEQKEIITDGLNKTGLQEIASILEFYQENTECFIYCDEEISNKLNQHVQTDSWAPTLEDALGNVNQEIDKIDAREEQYALAVLKVEESIQNIEQYYDNLKGSPEAEFESVTNALNGGYTAPSSGGDPIVNPQALPTGRNMYSINAETTPTEEAWTVGKRLAESLLEEELKTKGDYPEKVSFTLWSTNFISTEGATIAQILYLIGAEPVRGGTGSVQSLRLIPVEELGRPRIDVVVQTSGQLRDLAASRLALINKAILMAAEVESEDVSNNYVRKGVLDAEEYMLNKGFSPLDARKYSVKRVFGGVNGNYGTGIMSVVEDGESWNDEAQVAQSYLSNMGAIYGENEDWGIYQEGVFEAALQNTEVVVQPRSSNTWGPLSLDHVYEFMGGLNLTVRNVTGNDPTAYFNDFRNTSNPRMQELGEAIGVETNSTVFNPKYIQELLDGQASSMETFAETFRNTYGWNVMKPEVIDDYIWNKYHEIYIEDSYDLNVRERFEKENPYALQEMTSVMLETARKGYWDASDAQLQELALLHADLVKDYNAGCSEFVCNNEKLREFISGQLSSEKAEEYRQNINKAREVQLEDSENSVVLEKEDQAENSIQANAETVDSDSNMFVWLISILIVLALAFFIIKKQKRND